VLGLLLGAGLIVFLEFVNDAIRRPSDIDKALGVSPLATLPYMETRTEIVVRRVFWIVFTTALVGGTAFALNYIHVNYLPLDLILDRVLERLGT